MGTRLLIAVAGCAVFASEAAACSCSGGGARAAARRSTAVYLGRVVGFGAPRPGTFGPWRTARLVVTQAVKGARVADTLAVDVPAENSCNPGFAVGREFLVYAVADPDAGGALATDVCVGTKPIACAARDLRELDVVVPRRARTCVPVVKEVPRRRPRPAT